MGQILQDKASILIYIGREDFHKLLVDLRGHMHSTTPHTQASIHVDKCFLSLPWICKVDKQRSSLPGRFGFGGRVGVI